MFKRIMVPLDGSELAERALPHAEYLAKTSGATLYLVRAVEPPAAVRTHGLGAPVNVYADVIGAQRQEAVEYLNGVGARLESDALSVQTAQLDGYAASALLDYVRQADIDLVVITAHGRSGLTRWAMGSVADRVIQGGLAAVLLIPNT
jgi:nucleotide-binding universal stress UspA family protein